MCARLANTAIKTRKASNIFKTLSQKATSNKFMPFIQSFYENYRRVNQFINGNLKNKMKYWKLIWVHTLICSLDLKMFFFLLYWKVSLKRLTNIDFFITDNNIVLQCQVSSIQYHEDINFRQHEKWRLNFMLPNDELIVNNSTIITRHLFTTDKSGN